MQFLDEILNETLIGYFKVELRKLRRIAVGFPPTHSTAQSPHKESKLK